VLKGNGKVVPRRSVRPLNPSETKWRSKRGKSINPPMPINGESDTQEPNDADSDADTEPAGELPDIEDILDSAGKVLNQQPMWDKVINAEIILQQFDKLQFGKVKRRSIDDNGKTNGTCSDDSIRNSIVCEIEFHSGEWREYAANIPVENMISQVDHKDHNIMLMRDIVDHRGMKPWRFQLKTSTIRQGLARGG
jgi:hypothetical protein